MLVLATLIDNPGEPQPETRYRDPGQLVALGYNGLVIFETAGLSGIANAEDVGSGEMRRWVEQHLEQLASAADDAVAAGLEVYICYDTLVLARGLVERDRATITCRNQPRMLCPASDAAATHSLRGLEFLLRRFPQVAGVVLRFGDNDADRIPFLAGNDLYAPHCPRCSAISKADRAVAAITRFHELVVNRFGKRLIARAWNVRPGGMHDNVDLCRQIADQLPGKPDADDLIVSFKFTETDFWRYQRWNPASLTLGDRPVRYELQFQREFEGKGGVPNWQPPLWRDGCPEVATDDQPAFGLAEVSDKVNLAGLWAWVRGGGWGGPFVKNERWIDANVVAVPMLADNPRVATTDMADAWIDQRISVQKDKAKSVLRQVLERSTKTILGSFYIEPYARLQKTPWHPNGDWIQDDLLDARAAWRMVQAIADDQLDRVVAEKADAVGHMADDRAALQQIVTGGNRNDLDPLVCTMMYGESLFETMRDLLDGLVAYRRHRKRKDPSHAEHCRRRFLAAQSHWNHHTQRHGSMPGAATACREENFWDLTQQLIEELTA